MTREARMLYIPLEISELLHATLGPLGDILDREDHHWSPMVRKILSEYTRMRDLFLQQMHGESVISDIAHHTYLAAEKVCGLTSSAIKEEEDFSRWAAEVDGETTV